MATMTARVRATTREAERRAYIAELVASAPPVSEETHATLAMLLRPSLARLTRTRRARRP